MRKGGRNEEKRQEEGKARKTKPDNTIREGKGHEMRKPRKTAGDREDGGLTLFPPPPPVAAAPDLKPRSPAFSCVGNYPSV